MSLKKPVYLTRLVVLLSFISLFTDVASEMLYPVLPLYFEEIGFTVLWIGILEGVAEAIAGLTKGYFGKLSDAMGKRALFVRWGYLLSAVSKPLMGMLLWPLWVASSRTLDRIGKGIRTGARDALLSVSTEKKYKGRVFGFHRSMDTLGAAAGPVLALIFLYFYPGQYRWLLIAAFVPGLISVFLTFLVKDVKTVEPSKKPSGHFFSFLGYLKSGPLRYRKVLFGLMGFALVNSTDMLLLLILKFKGVDDLQIITIYIFYNLVYALFSFPAGYLGDKAGLRKTFMIGLVIFAAVYGSLSLANETWMYYAIFMLYGIYASATEGISKAWLTNLVPVEETGTAIGTYTAMNSILALVASSAAGAVWYWFGLEWMLWITVAGTILTLVYFGSLKNLSNNNTE